MRSMLEKITLYDILGYLLPGCFLETLVCLEYILDMKVKLNTMIEQLQMIS